MGSVRVLWTRGVVRNQGVAFNHIRPKHVSVLSAGEPYTRPLYEAPKLCLSRSAVTQTPADARRCTAVMRLTLNFEEGGRITTGLSLDLVNGRTPLGFVASVLYTSRLGSASEKDKRATEQDNCGGVVSARLKLSRKHCQSGRCGLEGWRGGGVCVLGGSCSGKGCDIIYS